MDMAAVKEYPGRGTAEAGLVKAIVPDRRSVETCMSHHSAKIYNVSNESGRKFIEMNLSDFAFMAYNRRQVFKRFR